MTFDCDVSVLNLSVEFRFKAFSSVARKKHFFLHRCAADFFLGHVEIFEFPEPVVDEMLKGQQRMMGLSSGSEVNKKLFERLLHFAESKHPGMSG